MSAPRPIWQRKTREKPRGPRTPAPWIFPQPAPAAGDATCETSAEGGTCVLRTAEDTRQRLLRRGSAEGQPSGEACGGLRQPRRSGFRRWAIGAKPHERRSGGIGRGRQDKTPYRPSHNLVSLAMPADHCPISTYESERRTKCAEALLPHAASAAKPSRIQPNRQLNRKLATETLICRRHRLLTQKERMSSFYGTIPPSASETEDRVMTRDFLRSTLDSTSSSQGSKE